MTTWHHIPKDHNLTFRIYFHKFHVGKVFLVKPVVSGDVDITCYTIYNSRALRDLTTSPWRWKSRRLSKWALKNKETKPPRPLESRTLKLLSVLQQWQQSPSWFQLDPWSITSRRPSSWDMVPLSYPYLLACSDLPLDCQIADFHDEISFIFTSVVVLTWDSRKIWLPLQSHTSIECRERSAHIKHQW
jgi:hypothetical protein